MSCKLLIQIMLGFDSHVSGTRVIVGIVIVSLVGGEGLVLLHRHRVLASVK